jgi:nucleoside-diphosphate-sugar epimerase
MIFAITGGTGFIGQKLVKQLVDDGHEVRVLSRKNTINTGGELYRGNLLTLNVLQSFVANVDVLFNCAGEIRDVTVMRSIHVDGTINLLDAVIKEAHRTGKRIHWVQLSSVGAYGPPSCVPNLERIITETSPNSPVGEYESTKTDADKLIVEACACNSISYSILRPSNVIGECMPNQSLRSLIRMVRRGLYFYVGRPGAIANYVHVTDVVSALLKCAFVPAAKGEIYNLSSDCLLEDIVQQISKTLGVRQPWLRVQERSIRIMVDLVGKRIPIPLTHSRIDALVMRTHYPADKIISELGYVFSKPMPAGVDGLVRECF